MSVNRDDQNLAADQAAVDNHDVQEAPGAAQAAEGNQTVASQPTLSKDAQSTLDLIRSAFQRDNQTLDQSQNETRQNWSRLWPSLASANRAGIACSDGIESVRREALARLNGGDEMITEVVNAVFEHDRNALAARQAEATQSVFSNLVAYDIKHDEEQLRIQGDLKAAEDELEATYREHEAWKRFFHGSDYGGIDDGDEMLDAFCTGARQLLAQFLYRRTNDPLELRLKEVLKKFGVTPGTADDSEEQGQESQSGEKPTLDLGIADLTKLPPLKPKEPIAEPPDTFSSAKRKVEKRRMPTNPNREPIQQLPPETGNRPETAKDQESGTDRAQSIPKNGPEKNSSGKPTDGNRGSKPQQTSEPKRESKPEPEAGSKSSDKPKSGEAGQPEVKRHREVLGLAARRREKRERDRARKAERGNNDRFTKSLQDPPQPQPPQQPMAQAQAQAQQMLENEAREDEELATPSSCPKMIDPRKSYTPTLEAARYVGNPNNLSDPKKFDAKENIILQCLADGLTVAATARIAGVSRTTVYARIADPAWRNIIESYRLDERNRMVAKRRKLVSWMCDHILMRLAKCKGTKTFDVLSRNLLQWSKMVG